MPHPTLDTTLTVIRDKATRMGGDRVRLLEAIKQEGSISAAARHVGLSYKGAWDAVNAMNNLFGQPLVTGQTGGRKGGGATLTPAGEEVVTAFTGMEAEISRFMSTLDDHLKSRSSRIPASFLWNMMMKTSSRNQLLCTIRSINHDNVEAEVGLELGDGQKLTAVITRQSIDDLGLSTGGQCFALIKSSFVILMPEDPNVRMSARNRLCGTVLHHDDGEINSEITLDLGGGMTLVSVITRESADSLGLKTGDRACAVVKSSHIILAVQRGA